MEISLALRKREFQQLAVLGELIRVVFPSPPCLLFGDSCVFLPSLCLAFLLLSCPLSRKIKHSSIYGNAAFIRATARISFDSYVWMLPVV